MRPLRNLVVDAASGPTPRLVWLSQTSLAKVLGFEFNFNILAKKCAAVNALVFGNADAPHSFCTILLENFRSFEKSLACGCDVIYKDNFFRWLV